MLRLSSSQGRSALRAPFICTSCRSGLLVRGGTRLPGAVATLCAARHYSTETQPGPQQPDQQPDQQQSSVGTRRKRRAARVARFRTTRSWAKAAPSPDSAAPSTDPADPTDPTDSTGSTPTSQLWRETLDALKDSQPPPSSPPTSEQSAAAALGDLRKALQKKLPNGSAAESTTHEKVSPAAAPKKAKAKAKKAVPEPPRVSLAAALGFVPRPPAAEVKPVKKPAEKPAEKPATKATKAKAKPSSPSSPPPPPPPPQPQGKLPTALGALEPLGIATGTRKKKEIPSSFVVNHIDPRTLDLTPIEKNEQPPVPSLAYGLDRVLFNPGVYHVQDPRSRVYNFDPYLERIMPVGEFDFNAIKQYVTSSKDTTLIDIAAEHKMKYTGSTSSMTSTLAHFHYLVSAWRSINPKLMSRGFVVDSSNFTRIMRCPSATFLHYKDGVYAIDADKEYDSANVLSMLGKSMEKFLTLPKEEYEKYRKTNSHQLTDEDRNGPEAFHYTTLGDFMMRSQLDAYDPRLPGTGMFDLKTRAVVTIRMDARDYRKGVGYEIRDRFGQWESFEREYYDMIRSAFLKYSLQVRMGRMDGIFVAFHNTERIFGFQYVPLPEMDLALHGQADVTLGDQEFKVSIHLLNKVLDKVTAKYPGRHLRLHFETRGEDGRPFMYIFAKPVTPVQIENIQGATRAEIEAFEAHIMGIMSEAARAREEEDAGGEAVEEAGEDDMNDEIEGAVTDPEAWEDIMAKVEDELEDEEHGMKFVRQAIENALQESDLLRSTDEDQRAIDAFLEALTSSGRPAQESLNAAEEPAEEQAEEQLEEEAEEQAEEQVEEHVEEQVADNSKTEWPIESSESVTESDATPTSTLTETEQVEKDVEVPIEGQVEKPVEEQVETRAEEQLEVPVEEQPEAPSEEPQGEAQSPAADDSPAEEPTLKDLIVKLAARIRAAPSEKRISLIEEDDVPEEETPAHALRLRKIERILSELAEWDEADRGEGNRVVEKGSVTPGAQESAEGAAEGEQPSETEAAPTEAATKPFSTKGFVDEDTGGELYGLVLTLRNKVDGQYVVRPQNLKPNQRWTVEYAVEEVNPDRAHTLYSMVLKRRKNIHDATKTSKDSWYGMFRGSLEKYSSLGRRFRQSENQRQRERPVYVYGSDKPGPSK